MERFEPIIERKNIFVVGFEHIFVRKKEISVSPKMKKRNENRLEKDFQENIEL
jgi:hypothetical protein